MFLLNILRAVTLALACISGTLALPNNSPSQLPILEPCETASGLATTYTQGVIPGSCGQVNPDSAMIVALSNTYMLDQYKASYCGRQIQITNTGSSDGVGGAENVVHATVADTCAGCVGDHIDLSTAAWNVATDNAPWGWFEASWFFTDGL